MSKKISVVSLFSGIGGFEEGLAKSNFEFQIVMASEIEKNAITTYGYNFSTEKLKGDITKINEKEVPNHDLLCGGFPCQSFSVAGKLKGFNDIRGTLFFDVIRIVNEKKPKYIFLENVKNLISHDSGKTIKTMLKNISECGYTFDITIINSSEGGLPQNRERTYIVAVLSGKKEKFETDKRSGKINELKNWSNQNKLSTMNFFNKVIFNSKPKYLKDIIDYNSVDEKYFLSNDNVKKFISQIDEKNISNKEELKIIKVLDLPKNVHNDLERQRRVYSLNGISPTLLARSDSPKIIYKVENEYRIRKLTPYETLKVQGFDNKYIDNIRKHGMSDTQLYKQSGNAVSPPIITEILNYMKEYLFDE